jgi:uncharacterized delta-60 repeat protein
LVLLNADGSVDDRFNANITYESGREDFGEINCLALQTNGQILVGGYFDDINGITCYSLARLNVDGTLDTNFNAGTVFGNTDGGTTCLQVLSNGQILAGNTSGLYRFNGDGSLDTNFNAGANHYASSIAWQPDGKILALGSFSGSGGQSRTNLVRLRACLKIERGSAARDFACGQGGEARASPQRAARAEPTQSTGKRPAARRVFAIRPVWRRCSSLTDP